MARGMNCSWDGGGGVSGWGYLMFRHAYSKPQSVSFILGCLTVFCILLVTWKLPRQEANQGLSYGVQGGGLVGRNSIAIDLSLLLTNVECFYRVPAIHPIVPLFLMLFEVYMHVQYSWNWNVWFT